MFTQEGKLIEERLCSNCKEFVDRLIAIEEGEDIKYIQPNCKNFPSPCFPGDRIIYAWYKGKRSPCIVIEGLGPAED